MPSAKPRQLCLYRYDPLDRLVHQSQAGTPKLQRFYCKSRLATEIQGALNYSIVQHGDQLLGQQQREGDAVDTTLLATSATLDIAHAQGQPSAQAHHLFALWTSACREWIAQPAGL